MKNCIDCKFDRLNSQGQRMIQCGQGHTRPFQKIIKECHAWGEKEKCWWCRDFKRFEDEFKGTHAWGQFYEVVKKLIGLHPDEPKCPICGKRLEDV